MTSQRYWFFCLIFEMIISPLTYLLLIKSHCYLGSETKSKSKAWWVNISKHGALKVSACSDSSSGHVLPPLQQHWGPRSPEVHQLCGGQPHGGQNYRLWLPHHPEPWERWGWLLFSSFSHNVAWLSIHFYCTSVSPLRPVDGSRTPS